MDRSLISNTNPGDPININITPIGYDITPDAYQLDDPVFLRHVLAALSVVYNTFYIYLCYRQIRVCYRHTLVPSQMAHLMTPVLFQECRMAELRKTEQKLFAYFIDAILSVLELYFSVYERLLLIILGAYGATGNIRWINMSYVGLLVVYIEARTLPSLVFNKILERHFKVDPLETTPIIGLICTLILLIALVQVLLIPLTICVWEIHILGGRYFALWIWLFAFVISLLVILFISFCHVPCLGKSVPLPEGTLLDSLQPILKHFGFPSNCVYILQTHQHIKASAYAWGCFCFKAIFLLDSLLLNRTKYLKDLNEEPDNQGGLVDADVVAIVGHELAHWRFFHFCKSFIIVHVALLIYMGLFTTVFNTVVLYEAFGFSPDFYPEMVGYWLMYKYVMPPYLAIAKWIVFYFLRHFEYAADKYIFHLNLLEPLKRALLKLFADNMVYPYVDHWYLMWNNRKPSCLQRIKYLQKLEFPNTVSNLELV